MSDDRVKKALVIKTQGNIINMYMIGKTLSMDNVIPAEIFRFASGLTYSNTLERVIVFVKYPNIENIISIFTNAGSAAYKNNMDLSIKLYMEVVEKGGIM